MREFTFDAIGTSWKITVYQEISDECASNVLAQIKDRIAQFDRDYSRFRSDSLVTRIAQAPGRFTLPEDAPPLFAIYYDLYKRTNGLLTPLIGTMISDAGYDATYSLTQKKILETPPEWEEVLRYTHPILETKQSVLFDFGAAGKGYLVDIVGTVLEKNIISNYCINAGGDILHLGSTAIQVGLENPFNMDQVIGIYPLKNESICGSAGTRRAWSTFTHIINPKTQQSPTEIVATWVVAKQALIADALATCLFFVPPKTLTDHYNFEYLIVYSDQSIAKSPGFAAELFT